MSLRILYAREHTTIWPGLGVFLAGPTPPEERMENSWRREFIRRLSEDKRLSPLVTAVMPEPKNCSWKEILIKSGNNDYDRAVNKQIPWELQYLALCDITVFWFATYWDEETGNQFPANIGPTTRCEFGYYLQEYLKNKDKRAFIIGSPADAQNVEWPKQMAKAHGLKWHTLSVPDKDKLVPDSLISEVSEILIKGLN